MNDAPRFLVIGDMSRSRWRICARTAYDESVLYTRDTQRLKHLNGTDIRNLLLSKVHVVRDV